MKKLSIIIFTFCSIILGGCKINHTYTNMNQLTSICPEVERLDGATAYEIVKELIIDYPNLQIMFETKEQQNTIIFAHLKDFEVTTALSYVAQTIHSDVTIENGTLLFKLKSL